MSLPKFGLTYILVDDQPQPVLGANMDVVGIVGPCSTAKVSRFPLNTPVLFYSNDTTLAHDLGPDGYVLDAIEAINDQLADYQVAAQCVYVRTDYGANADANIKLAQTIANIMGQSTAGSGVHAFLKAPNSLYCTPRLIMAPGYTGQMANSLDTLETVNDGIGYTPGQEYTVNFTPDAGEANGAYLVLPQAHAIANLYGQITDEDITITSYGAYFSKAPLASLAAPDGPPITALPASGSIVFSRNPGVGATIGLGGVTWSFISGASTGTSTQIKADLNATLNELVTNLNASANSTISQNTYSTAGGVLTIVQDANGAIGNNYTLATTVTGATISATKLSGGRDAAVATQCTLLGTISLGANPVCAELPGVLNQLIGYAFVESAGTSQIGDISWRNTMNSRRLIPLSGGVRTIDIDTGLVVMRPVAPRFIGMQIAKDHEVGAPGHSAANRPIQGIVAPGRNIEFSLTDGACEGQQLLYANVGIVVRGNVGVETAISSGGFMGIVLDNASDETLWQMYSVCRMRDFIHLSLMPALRRYLGRTNITKQTVINILTTVGDFLGNAKARDWILDYRMSFKGSLNSASEIRLGHLTIGFAAEEPPITERITTMSARYRPAIDSMVMQLEQQLNMAA